MCQFNSQCQGEIILDESYSYCNQCLHKVCHWCNGTTLARLNECSECDQWDYVGDTSIQKKLYQSSK